MKSVFDFIKKIPAGLVPTFRGKVLGAAISVLILASIVYTYNSVKTGREIIGKEILKRAEVLTHLASEIGELPLISENPELLKKAVSSLKKVPEVSFVAFYDNKMNLLMKEGVFILPARILSDFSKMAVFEEKDYYDLYSPVSTVKARKDIDIFQETDTIEEVKENVGWVRIGFSKAFMKEAGKTIIYRGLIIAMVFTVGSIILVYKLFTAAAMPLTLLVNAVKSIGKGKYPEIPISSSDEIGTLASEFNTMSRAISEREEMLHESEARFRLLLESTAEAIYGLDMDGNCTFVNPACLKMLGYDNTDKLINKNLHDLIHHTGKDGSPYPKEECRSYKSFRESIGTHADDEVLRRKDGTSFPAEYWSYPIVRNGRTVGSVTTFFDITNRKQAEAEIRSNYTFQTIINSILSLSLEDMPLDKLLEISIGHILSIPGLAFKAMGSIHLVENDPGVLVMKSWKGLTKKTLESCARVPFGKCICGRAAIEQDIVFADRIDERHDIRYEGMMPHGHYCIPIILEGKTAGVINIHLWEGHRRSKKEEEFLTSIANTLAGIIARKRAEDKIKEYSETLEQKVKERTKELETKNKDLENYNKLFIDREFRIKELRDRVKALKKRN